MLWSGDKAWRQSGERRMLCGLQLPGPNNQQLAFKGKVADVDQSKVWPAGTCLGIDPSTNQPTDIPVDCAAPHAMEVTGAVNLAEKFPAGLPPEPDQDAFIKDACTRMTDAYLAPIQLRSTTLTLIYSTISLPSWSAGSHQVSCSIGATLGNGGWSTLLNSAKGPLMINGQPPVAAAGHPRGAAEPAADPDAAGRHVDARTSSQSTAASRSSSEQSSDASGQQTQHMPGQQPAGTRRRRHAPPHDACAAASRATRSSTGRPHRRGRRAMARHPQMARGPRDARRLAHAAWTCHLRRAAPGTRRRARPCRSDPAAAGAVAAMAVRMSPQRFDELVSDALDQIPPELAAAIDNVVVLVEEPPPRGTRPARPVRGRRADRTRLVVRGSLPDTITIYRDALLDVCETEDEVVDEVAITVIHEIAHHFGIDDDRLHELGWA